MIQQKKQETDGKEVVKPVQLSSLCKGASVVLSAGDGEKGGKPQEQARAQTGDFSAKKKQSLYPWE